MPRQNPKHIADRIEFFEQRILVETNPKLLKWYREELIRLNPNAEVPKVAGMIHTGPRQKIIPKQEGPTVHYRGPDHRDYRGTERQANSASERIYYPHQNLTPQQYFEGSKRGPLQCASEHCHRCGGEGILKGLAYCPCVYRSIARDMVKKYVDVHYQIPGQVGMFMGVNGPYCDMKMSNFTIDIELACKYVFNRVEQLIFQRFWCPITAKRINADAGGKTPPWKVMVRFMNSGWAIRRGLRKRGDQPFTRVTFFQMFYHMQLKLGQISLDRGLYPSGWYFSQKRMTAHSMGGGYGMGSTWRRDQWLNGGYYAEMIRQAPEQAPKRFNGPVMPPMDHPARTARGQVSNDNQLKDHKQVPKVQFDVDSFGPRGGMSKRQLRMQARQKNQRSK